MIRNKRLLFTAFIILLLTASWLRLHPTKANPEHIESRIDTTLVNLTVRQFDEHGTLINVLTTPLLEHFPQGDVHLLQNPHISISEQDQPNWEIRSQKAKSYANGQRITFMNQVIVHQNKSEHTEESTLRTEEITYFPKEKKASTDLLISFEQAGNFVQSIGMNAYLAEKRVELLHQARGLYEPTATPNKPAIHTYADSILYYPARHLMELKGNARVVQGENSMSADFILYDTIKQNVLTQNMGKNRTTIIFHPDKKTT